MEELIIKIVKILNQFATEELGNRLSQFSMTGLKQIILNELKDFEKCPQDLSKEKKEQKIKR